MADYTQVTRLFRGIVPVVQTPFDPFDRVDESSLERLLDDAIDAGASGFLAPAVASEAAYLSRHEREAIVRRIATTCSERVPFIVGCSAGDVAECREHAQLARYVGATAYLVAVPHELYQHPEKVIPFFKAVVAGNDYPLIIQDFEFNRPGLPVETVRQLQSELPTLVGVKIETVPAGPKYTGVRAACGGRFFICGGWAVPQMVEALDRGVDAMIPESSMVRVYTAIYRAHQRGDREYAVWLFRSLVVILAFSNQEVGTSIAFFKRLLVRRGIFNTDRIRWPGFEWDQYNSRIAEELIELYLKLERSVS